MGKTRKALVFSTANKYLGKLLSLAAIVIISRYLTPNEIGVFVIANALIIIAAQLKAFGVGNYLIRKADLTPQVIRSALGVSIVISWFIGFLLIFSASGIESFYEESDIASLIYILSISFFISPFIGISQALLFKDFKFLNNSIIEVVTSLSIFIITITLVFLDFSYFSLAIAAATGAPIQLFLTAFIAPNYLYWRPNFKSFTLIAKFGGIVTLAGLIRKLTITFPDLIIGKLGTSTSVAIYSRGAGFIDFINSTITEGIHPVTAPYLAEQKKHGNIEAGYVKMQVLLCALTWPILAVASIASYPIILFFFGSQWEAAVPIASVLCVWAMIRSTYSFSTTLLITTGLQNLTLFKDSLICAITLVLVYTLYNQGLVAIAWGITFGALIDLFLVMLILKYKLNFTLLSAVRNNFKNIFLSSVCGGLTLFIDYCIDFQSVSHVSAISLIAVINAPAWFLVIKFQKNPIYDEINKLFNNKFNPIKHGNSTSNFQ